MATPSWSKTLQEVLQHNTVEKTFKSSKGTDYIAQVIPEIEVVSTGSLVEDNGTFKYAIVDTIHQLEYEIKTLNKVDVQFGTKLVFKDVRGGAVGNSSRGWYSAESVSLAK